MPESERVTPRGEAAALMPPPRPREFYERGVLVEGVTTILAPAKYLYEFWRDPTRLPLLIRPLEDVQVLDAMRSRWTVRGAEGTRLEWVAQIINDQPGRVLAWRSVEAAAVHHVGAIRFTPAPGGQGTEMRVRLEYVLPDDEAGRSLARALGHHPDARLRTDLARFKQLVETGEIATGDVVPPAVSIRSDAGAHRAREWTPDAVTEASSESFPASDAPGWRSESL